MQQLTSTSAVDHLRVVAAPRDRPETLLDVLLSAVQEAPEQLLVQVDRDGAEREHTYRELLAGALLVAGGFRAAELPVGSPVILLSGGSEDFLPCFWGALAAGLVPVPLAPVREKVLAVWVALQRPPLVVPDALEPLLRRAHASAGASGTLRLLTLSALRAGAPLADVHVAAGDDTAFLQFSSGSTGAPRGVELSHANVLANLEQTRAAGAAQPGDVLVSWLPYFHDMGLIGAHLAPLSVGSKQVKLDPVDFSKRPGLWYEVASRHRATLLPMASFAMALTLSRVPSEEIARLDLSSVRLLGVGAEPIPVRTWRRFLDHLRPAGLAPGALTPMYGLAEATLAVTFPPIGEVAQPLALDRRALAKGRALDVAPGEPAPLDGPDSTPGPAEFLSVGRCVPGGELRIVSDAGETLADDRVGQVEYRGPNVACGYHRNPGETARTFVDGWLRTGDVGFLRAGRLCITGRAKDVLYVHGQKYSAADLEQVVAATPGLPPGRVAVVGAADADTGVERVAVFVSSRTPLSSEQVAVLTAVRARVREALAFGDVCVLPIASADFPRTTSGKLRRGSLRDAFAAGHFAELEDEVARLCAAAETSLSDEPQPVPPSRADVEAQITEIWADVLSVPLSSISRHDSFLAIGGSSLTAMQVLGRLEETFGGRLEPAVLRDCATVAALAEHLLGRASGGVRSNTAEPQRQSPAAVIGLACRFPDADSPAAFWDNLVHARDSVTEVPADRWPLLPHVRARWGAFLDDVAGFDADYFGVDAAEAAVMDPHARIFLEVAAEALERAGYGGGRRVGRRIGVFVAVGESGYASLLQRALDSGVAVPPTALVGNLRNLIAARVAHCLDLSGPVLAVDTACSSSLVALHLARSSLVTGECDLAVVGGVSLNLTSTPYQLLEAAQALSPTGRCHAFSADADGFVPGEGAAAVVLEPLAAAQAAGDPVLALVRGSAVNNDGRSLSLMAPNPLLQEAVLADAYRVSGVDPATVSYVEAHGTGTAIGDPIEARSLLRTFPPATAAAPRWLGSVKTNLGHLLNAAGMPGLLKVVLALQHRQLPASLHYASPSPQFDLAAAGLTVVTELRDWTADAPRRAGINGFGFGGTNVHVILEEAPSSDRCPVPAKHPPGPELLRLSAASETALAAVLRDLAAHCRAAPDVDLGALCSSVAVARDERSHRLALVTGGHLAEQLEDLLRRPGPLGARARRRPRLAWVFPGQGAQVVGMGRALYESQPVYRELIGELSAALGPVRGRTLVAWSLDLDADPAELAQTAVAQPLLVAYELSLAEQLGSWGIAADAVLGHSVGELAAAAVAGALSPLEAVRFAAERGAAMQDRCAAGAMAAITGPEKAVRAAVAASGELSLAAVNGPTSFVIAGPGPAVDAAVAALGERGCRARRLSVSHAFHSAMLDGALGATRAAARRLSLQPQRVPLLSTVTGEWGPTFDADYLERHARAPVVFGPAVQRLLDEGYDTFLEVGPGSTLTSLVRAGVRARAAGEDDVLALPALPGRAGVGPEPSALLETLGRLWVRGVQVRPPASPDRARVPVPTYPYQRRRYWLPEVPASLPVAPECGPISTLLHRLTWQDAPLPAGAVLRSVCVAGGTAHTAQLLAARLSRRGVDVQRRGLGQLDAIPAVSALVLLDDPEVGLDELAALDSAARAAATAMLELARGLPARPVPLIVVTEDAELTGTGAERANPGQAIRRGLAWALAEEEPRQSVRVVDLSSGDDEVERLEALVRELDAPPTPGQAESVAWRGGRRLAKVPVLGEVLRPDRASDLPVSGSYLIVGGAGGVGAEVARYLAGRGRPQLYLAGRSAECRPGLLAELSRLGAAAQYVAADLSVTADVEALVAALPPLDGVFQAAGVVRPGLLRASSVAEIVDVLAPKVRGTVLLARALERLGRRPDVFVAFSSIASALPGYAGGLGAYAAANASLDAFALAETRAGRPLQVLNFAAWADTGLAASAAFRSAAAAKGVPQISPVEALRALHDATSVADAQLLVLDARQGLPAARREPAAEVRGDEASFDGSTRDLVAGLIAAELGLRPAELDHEASFLAMGLDSLTAVDLVKKLERELGRALPTTLLFEYPSVRQLSNHLSTALPSPTSAEVVVPQSGPATFALTPVQLAFWTSGRLHPDVPAYACLRQRLAGDVDDDLLARSLSWLERRHPMLRLRIRVDGAEPRQLTVPELTGPYAESSRPAWFATADLDRPLDEIEDELCNRGFELEREAPIRALLVRESGDAAELLLVLHHIAADGASLHVLSEELWQIYTALAQGAVPELPELASEFRDQVQLTEELRASEAFAADCRYWRDRLKVTSSSPALTFTGDSDALPSAPLAARQFATSVALTQALRTHAAELDVSLFHLVLAAYVRRLADWSGQPDVTVNVARSGRDARLAAVGRLVGPFADTLPMTVRVPPAADVDGVAQAVRGAWLISEQHGSVTSLDLARLLPTMDSAPRVVGSASFSFARFPYQVEPDCPVTVTATAARTASAATRLGLLCWEFDGALRFSWNYPSRLCPPETSARLSRELLAELEAVAGMTPRPVQPGIAQRIVSQCRATPGAVAVESGNERMTYAELQRSASRLAARLRDDGVSRGDRVALLTGEAAETAVGILAVLLVGAAWVPLDATHPTERLTGLLVQAEARVVVCAPATRGVAEGLGRPVVELGQGSAAANDHDPKKLEPPPDPQDIAYVIFTSGSTGRPKGVPITHLALTMYLDWAISTFGYATTDRMAATSSICFDASVRQLVAPLLVGATIVAVPRDLRRDPQALLSAMERGRVTVWSSVPTLWQQLLRAAERQTALTGAVPDLSALRWVHVGGEALPPAWVRQWFELFGPEQRIVNLYGPTEATINATYHVVDAAPDADATRIPIGTAVAGTGLHVVDDTGQSCAPGESGELLLAGPGLTPGYLGEAAASDSAFVLRGGTRYYRTGDRVSLRRDGKLEFLGRTDQQVSIGGHRVEPAEVELELQAHSSVDRAAVLAEPVPGSDPTASVLRLIAYVQPRQPAGLDPPDLAEDLRRFVSSRLPDYLVPAQIRLVEELPLTVAGKVNSARLGSTVTLGPAASRIGTPPGTETELLLASVWSSLLGVDQVCAEDDFFALGGDSIAVLEVFARLETSFAALPAPTALYRHRTLSALAAALDDWAASGPVPEATAPTAPGVVEPFALTAAQRGFLLAEALSPGAPSCLLGCFRLTGELDPQLFGRAVDLLVDRHLMLRVAVATGSRPPTQSEVPGAALPVAYHEIAPAELSRHLAEEREHRLDSSGWPLVRLRLLRLGPDEHALVVYGHHLIGDGYSVVLLGQDLMALYDGLATGQPASLPPLRSTFRDYARLLESAETPKADELPDRNLHSYSAPKLRRRGGRAAESGPPPTASFTVDGPTVSGLRRLAASGGVTPFTPLLTAYYRAICRLTGHDDLLLGVVSTGRDHALPDITRIVGPFATVVPVRLSLPGPRFQSQLSEVAAAVAAARSDGATMQRLANGAGASTPSALGAQFLFSYLDFDALGSLSGKTLRLTWDESGTELEPPPIGTDMLLTVRSVEDRLLVTLRATAGALSSPELLEFADGLHADLSDSARSLSPDPSPRAFEPGKSSDPTPRTALVESALSLPALPESALPLPALPESALLDAALVGYLPAPGDLASLVGLPSSDGFGREIRTGLFPDGRPRLLDVLTTPLGRSGFICLPVFAPDLFAGTSEILAGQTAGAVELAAGLGARCVSLAGMIPAYTGYGFGVVQALTNGTSRVTTGHAATAASVVQTTLAALSQTGRNLSQRALAVVGLGSIGKSSLELLLALQTEAPQRLVLCDLAGRSAQLTELAAGLSERGQQVEVALCDADGQLPQAAYAADLIVAAISADRPVLDVNRLRPGTIVVDDSFPHCFDPQVAIRRMTQREDVLVVGGGMLCCGPTVQTPVEDPLLAGYAPRLLRLGLPDTIASCRIESLLQARQPDLPVVHGLVDVSLALSYWDRLAAAGVEAAPLHLGSYVVTAATLRAVARI